ncbi:MAG: T9SS type A sorting domain-containing protein [Bacteroidetes bacterium]|nr:T9SS type A sorting domain-containing protein [Bacteroidota bacterium]
MKQFYMLALGGLVSFTVSAQKACAPANVARTQLNESKTSTPVLDGERVTIWENSISDCSEWMMGNANEPGANLDWVCGPNLAPSGDYAIAGINSATAEDGLLLLDSDAAGSAVGPLENCWADLVVPFSTLGNPSVALNFYNYFRTYQSDSEWCLLEVSRDGSTWPDVSTNDEVDGFVTYDEAEGPVQARWDLFQNLGGGEATANPELKSVNISDVAGDQAEVYLRFRWVGSWGYAWMVDDLEAVEIPAYDVTVANYESYTDEAFTNLYEYGVWPQSQLPDTLYYGCEVLNFGDSLATNVYGSLDFNGTMFDGPALSSLTSGSVDTVYVPYATDVAVGTYDMLLTLNMDSVDANMDNNTSASSYAVTEYQWGRDNGNILGDNTSDGTEDYIEMPLYQVLEDATIYGVDVAVMEGTEEFTPVRGFLVDALDDLALTEQYGGEVASSPEVELVPSNFNSGEGDIVWYTFVFDEPYEAAAGDLLGAAFEHYGGAPVFIGRGQPVPAQTVFVYGPYGSGGVYDWYYQTSTPMVRLNLNPDAVTTTGDVTQAENVEMFPAYPNPSGDNTNIRYNLNQASEVTFELRDVMGKLVETRDLGTLPAGQNTLTVETSSLGAGSYTATLTVNGARTTQKLMVK